MMSRSTRRIRECIFSCLRSWLVLKDRNPPQVSRSGGEKPPRPAELHCREARNRALLGAFSNLKHTKPLARTRMNAARILAPQLSEAIARLEHAAVAFGVIVLDANIAIGPAQDGTRTEREDNHRRIE